MTNFRIAVCEDKKKANEKYQGFAEVECAAHTEINKEI